MVQSGQHQCQWEKSEVGVFAGPDLSESGLVLALDAGNTKSYPGSGTTWTDLSGRGNNGTLVNGVGYVGTNGGSLSFDGSNDYISIPSSNNKFSWTPSGSGNNNLSIEMWLKCGETDAYMLSKPWNGSGEYNYFIINGVFSTRVGAQSNSLSFSGFSTNTWEYFCFIFTPTQKAVYKNGILNAGFTNHGMTTNTTDFGDLSLPLSIMTLYPYGEGWGGNTGFSTPGNVSSLKIYNRVLTAAEIQQNFNALRGRFGI